jgi:hypothetical protein
MLVGMYEFGEAELLHPEEILGRFKKIFGREMTVQERQCSFMPVDQLIHCVSRKTRLNENQRTHFETDTLGALCSALPRFGTGAGADPIPFRACIGANDRTLPGLQTADSTDCR